LLVSKAAAIISLAQSLAQVPCLRYVRAEAIFFSAVLKTVALIAKKFSRMFKKATALSLFLSKGSGAVPKI